MTKCMEGVEILGRGLFLYRKISVKPTIFKSLKLKESKNTSLTVMVKDILIALTPK